MIYSLGIEGDTSICRTVEDIMRLYSYSSKLHTLVKVKWAAARFITAGIISGIVLLFGAVKLDQSVVHVFGSHLSDTLIIENDFLRQQVSSISFQTGRLEIQTVHMNERLDKLKISLYRSKIVVDTVPRFADRVKARDLSVIGSK